MTHNGHVSDFITGIRFHLNPPFRKNFMTQ
jgi:hypothetical protein